MDLNQESQYKSISIHTFIETMPQIAFLADEEGHLTHYNQRHYEYTGIPREESEGWKWKNTPIIHPDDLESTIERWTHSLKTGAPYENEYRLRRYDGEYRWHLARALPIKDPQGKILGWVGTNTDIQDHKMLLEQLSEEKSLREQFVATLTHDLRTPLTAAKMSAEILQKKADDPILVRKLVNRISNNIDRTVAMVRDLLDANNLKVGAGIPISVSLCRLDELASKVIENIQVTFGLKVHMQNATGEISGYWDCDELQRVIENLTSNAIKYGEENAQITLGLRHEINQVIISVHNFGKPISIEDQKTLFDFHSRSSSAIKSGKKGWGIGLTLVKGIAEAHRGRAWVESNQSGTTFFVSLPIDCR